MTDNELASMLNPMPSQDDNIQRFRGAEWFNAVTRRDVAVIGAGGIGSWLTFMLSRLNVGSIHLWDPDKVDSSNMAGQLFNHSNIGVYKVMAVRELCEIYSGYTRVCAYCQRFSSDFRYPGVIFMGVDNMSSRQEIYRYWKEHGKSLLIDGRLGAETLQVFCLQKDIPAYMREYESRWLFDDSEAEDTLCTYKQTSYCANMIASLMTNLFVNWCANREAPVMERSLPFMIEYTAEQMYLKQQI